MSFKTAESEAQGANSDHLPNHPSTEPESQRHSTISLDQAPASQPDLADLDSWEDVLHPSDAEQLKMSATTPEIPQNAIDELPQGSLTPAPNPIEYHDPEILNIQDSQESESIQENTSSTVVETFDINHTHDSEPNQDNNSSTLTGIRAIHSAEEATPAQGTILSIPTGKQGEIGDAEGAARFTKQLRYVRKMIDDVLLKRTQLRHDYQVLESCREYLHDSTTALWTTLQSLYPRALSERLPKEGGTDGLEGRRDNQQAELTSHGSVSLSLPTPELRVSAQDQDPMRHVHPSEADHAARDISKLYDDYNKDYQAMCDQEEKMKRSVDELSNREFHLEEKQKVIQKSMHSQTFASELREELMEEDIPLSETTSQSSANNTPPLVSDYFSRKGDVGILRERISELKFTHEEGLDTRAFIADREEGALEVSDEEFERNYRVRLEQLEVELKQAEAEANDLAEKCSREGLDIDAYRGIPHSEYGEDVVQLSLSNENLAGMPQTRKVSVKASLMAHAASRKKRVGDFSHGVPIAPDEPHGLKSVSSEHSSPSFTPDSIEHQDVGHEYDQVGRSTQRSKLSRALHRMPASQSQGRPSPDSKYVLGDPQPQQPLAGVHSMAYDSSRLRMRNEDQGPQPVQPMVWHEPTGGRFVYAVNPASQVGILLQTGPPALTTDPYLVDAGIFARRVVLGTDGESERLFDGFRKRNQPNDFFTVGKVFRVLWVEPLGEAETIVTSLEEGTSTDRFGEKVFSKVRRFVVIREGDTYCSALPITTYGGRGVSKPNVKKSEHSIIYTGKKAPEATPGEQPQRGEWGMRPNPIRVIPDNPADGLDELSRIDFGKIHTIQHKVKVQSYGRIHPHSLNDLVHQFRDVWSADTPALRTAKSARGVSSGDGTRSGAEPPGRRERLPASVFFAAR